MKKILLVFIFTFIINSFSFAKPVVPTENKPDSFIGTYNIVFFYSKAPLNAFTSDVDICNSKSYGNLIECRQNKVKIVYGRAQISKSKDGRYILENNLQLNNRTMYNMTPNDIYMYTKYSPANITSNGLNGDNKASGFTGRNVAEEFNLPSVSFNYKAENNMLVGKVNMRDKCTKVLGRCMKVKSVDIVLYLEKVSDKTVKNFAYSYSPVFSSDDDRKIFANFTDKPGTNLCNSN